MATMLNLQQLEPVPSWQSDNFTTVIEHQLTSRPNNAHIVHAASVIILNLIALTLSTNETLLDEAFIPDFQDMVRACVIKMRHAFMKEAHFPSRDSLWDHIRVDRNANSIWWSGFSELHEAFSERLRTAQDQHDALSIGAEYFRHSKVDDSQYAFLILSTEMRSVDQYPDKLPTFRVTEKLPEADAEEKNMLQQLMQWINLKDGVHSAAAIVENSQNFLNYETDSLEMEEDTSKLAFRSEL